MALECSLEKRYFQALLSGVSKLCFFREENPEISEKLIEEQIFGGEGEEAEVQIGKWKEFLIDVARRGWESSELEEKVGNLGLTEEQQHVLVAFWAKEWPKVRDSCRRKAMFNSGVRMMRWRVDRTTQTRDREEGSGGCAIVEIKTSQDEDILFEVSKDDVGMVLRQLEEAQKRARA